VSVVTKEILRAKKFLALIFSSVLLLAGCSTASTDPEQAVKLLEYENCLELQQNIFDEQNRIDKGALFGLTDPDTQTGRILFFDKFFLEKCSVYRP
jgi:hypothetical protein